MAEKNTVHPPETRSPRGVRMADDLWDFVDTLAEAQGDGNASRLIERWVREKRDHVRRVA